MSMIVNTCKDWFTESLPEMGRNIAWEGISIVGSVLEIADLVLAIFPTLGCSDTLNDNSLLDKEHTSHLLQAPYLVVLSCLAPPLAKKNESGESEITDLIDYCSELGALSDWVYNNICDRGYDLSSESDFLSRHVFSRLVNLAGTLALIATKIAELAFGIICAVASLITFGGFYGRYNQINELAFQYLAAINVIPDVLIGLRLTINPKGGFDWENIDHSGSDVDLNDIEDLETN